MQGPGCLHVNPAHNSKRLSSKAIASVITRNVVSRVLAIGLFTLELPKLERLMIGSPKTGNPIFVNAEQFKLMSILYDALFIMRPTVVNHSRVWSVSVFPSYLSFSRR